MPKRTPVRVPAGTNISVGPMRVYVANNRNGVCDTFVIFGKHALGHNWSVPEEILMELQDAAEHLVDFSRAEVVDGVPDVSGETGQLADSAPRALLSR